MITERMTQKEIEAELFADLPGVRNYTEKFTQKFRREVIKSPKFPVCVHKQYTSRRKNKWILIFKAHSKKDVGHLTRCVFISYYNCNHGYYAVVPHPPPHTHGMTIYTPHFFSRYSQRKEVDLHGVELMIHYFRNNTNLVSIIEEVQRPDGSTEKVIEGSTDEGVFLGLIQTDGILLAKTFITREMAKGEQIGLFSLYEDWRKEVFEKPSK